MYSQNHLALLSRHGGHEEIKLENYKKSYERLVCNWKSSIYKVSDNPAEPLCKDSGNVDDNVKKYLKSPSEQVKHLLSKEIVINNFFKEQKDWHKLLYSKFIANKDNENYVRQYLCGAVGLGKTRIVFSLILQLLNLRIAHRAVFIYVNSTENSTVEELKTVMSALKCPIGSVRIGMLTRNKVDYSGVKRLSYDKFKMEWKQEAINLYIVAAGQLAYYAEDLEKTKLLSKYKETVFLAVDECQLWSVRGRNKYWLLEKWLPKFQLYITATMFPEGLASIQVMSNKSRLHDQGYFMGNTTLRKAWEEELSVTNQESKCLYLRSKRSRTLCEARQEIELNMEGLPLQDYTYSCLTPVTIFVIIIKTSPELLEKSNNVRSKFNHPDILFQPGLAGFVSKTVFEEAELFPNLEKHYDNRTGKVYVKDKIIHALLDFLVRESRNVIIISRFRKRLRHIERILENTYEVNLMDGETTMQDRQKIIKQFSMKNDKSSRKTCVLLLIAKLALGINLQGASAVIFTEPNWSYLEVEQAIGRVARTGQTRNVKVYILVYNDTIETTILQQCIKTQFFLRFLRKLDKDGSKVRLHVKGECKTNPTTNEILNFYEEDRQVGLLMEITTGVETIFKFRESVKKTEPIRVALKRKFDQIGQ